ncbi:amidase family protein [Ferviditalea candida]|uniref:Amidase family protein n=1 Tax=Ferviditalea candida TaxID=3108399 RepID=A0ABU5ZJD7_9BACL|nr:amidase family protein [Paenibacillaceae bacterium T2]
MYNRQDKCRIDLVQNAIGDDPVGRSSRELLDPAVAEILDQALGMSMNEYYEKVFARYAFREKVRKFFENYDLLLTPTLPVPAFKAGQNIPAELHDRNIVSWVYYTYPFNLTGNPAASVPCGFTKDNLPVGLQIVGATNRETDIFKAAAAFEEAQPWADRKPPLME